MLMLHPTGSSLVLVLVLGGSRLGLMLSTSRLVVVASFVCLATWWLGRDFGALGGYGMDPKTALPLAILVAGG